MLKINKHQLDQLVGNLIKCFSDDLLLHKEAEPIFNFDSRGKFALIQQLWKQGCLHRSDFEDFVMDPESGFIQARDSKNRGKLMNEMVKLFILNSPYDFTKYIPNNPNYEGYLHEGLEWSKLVEGSRKNFMYDSCFKRGKLSRQKRFETPGELEEIRKTCLDFKTTGNKFYVKG